MSQPKAVDVDGNMPLYLGPLGATHAQMVAPAIAQPSNTVAMLTVTDGGVLLVRDAQLHSDLMMIQFSLFLIFVALMLLFATRRH